MRTCLQLLLTLGLVVVAPALARGAERSVLPLDGPWTLSADGIAASEAVVPGAFEETLGEAFDGVATYRTTFSLPEDFRGDRVVLEFEASATETVATLNGVEVGAHLGGWTAFRFDVTDVVRRDAPNEVVVRVDEKVGHDTQGFLPIVQPHFGGLWRPVRVLGLPAVHLDDLDLLAVGDPDAGTVEVEAPVVGPRDGCEVTFELVLPERIVRATLEEGRASLPVEGFERWDLDRPTRYDGTFTLRRDGDVLDRVPVKVAFRSIRAEGRRFLLNGCPLSVRGLLDWGYRPPFLAPDPSDELVRREIAEARARGFDLVKFCLWVPPRHVLEQFDAAGMLAWMEYPTWHPRFDDEHHAQLAREFDRFFAHDRNHPCVLFRSLTCETGPSASLDVVKDLYDRCKRRIPGAIVVDDSSWIAWNRVHDFYDDHPYGNNDTWPATLDRLNAHIEAREAKPLLLGEAIAADTWPDLDVADAAAWWAPIHLEAQRAWAERIAARFGEEVKARLTPWSLRFAMNQRKDQIETFREVVPEGGYVVSVARDFTLAEMGLMDARGDWKWDAGAWSWHGDTMLVLGRGTARAFAAGSVARLPLVVAHHGAENLPAGRVHWSFGGEEGTVEHAPIARGGPVPSSPAVELLLPVPAVRRPTPVTLEVRLDDAAHENSWVLWALPPEDPGDGDGGAPVLESLDAAALERIVSGGAAVVLAHGAPGSFTAPSTWLLRGSLWFPEHPLLQTFPPEFFLDLAVKDIHPAGLLPLDALFDHVTPIVGFWETHDIREVRDRALAWETRVGDGRLLVTSLRPAGAAGAALLAALRRHVTEGPEPPTRLPDDLVGAMRDRLTSRTVDLTHRTWRFRPEGEDEWRDIAIGRAWEGLGFPTLDGWATYALEIDVDPSWEGEPLWLHFEGVDDAFEVDFDGERRGGGGDIETRRTAFDEASSHRLAERVTAGLHRIEVRVYDWYGAGGIHRPVTLSTRPSGVASSFLSSPR